jgi:hypothetical protein
MVHGSRGNKGKKLSISAKRSAHAALRWNIMTGSPFLQEQEQLAAIREQMDRSNESVPNPDKDFEGGFGGQGDLEDRYATTSGDH